MLHNILVSTKMILLYLVKVSNRSQGFKSFYLNARKGFNLPAFRIKESLADKIIKFHARLYCGGFHDELFKVA